MRTKMMLSIAIVAVATSAPASAPASASPKKATLCVKAWGVRQAVIKKHGKRAPGRNICRQGIVKGDGIAVPTVHQKAVYLRQLKRLIAPTHHALLARVAVNPSQSPAGVKTASVRGIGAGGSSNPYVNPNCESGGNPQVVSPAGYWGKYQFDKQTWTRFGGAGSSYGNASEAEQDRVAANVTYDAWPNC